MSHRIALVLVVIGLVWLLPSYSKVGDGALLDPPSSFGLKLLNKLSGDENVFVSPFSIHSCLEMAYAGASDKTATNMANVLDISGLNAQRAAANYTSLIHELTTPLNNPSITGPGKSLTLEIANSIWANKSVNFVPAYSQLLQNSYNAEAKTIDFSKPSAVGTINSWVKNKTHDKIDSIVQTLDPSTLLMLINSAYFKAHWDKVFDKSLTSSKDFHLLSGETAKAMMMQREGRYSYYEDNNLQAIKLPYTDSRFAMYVFLPRGNSDVNKFCQSLNGDTWTQYMSKMSTRPGKLNLPRFKMDYQIKLKQLLSQMGMADAFSTSANFSQMTVPPPKPFIGEVIHKTYVSVDEEGTEAAAVTAIAMMGASASGAPVSPFVMNVDHPFCFAVVYQRDSGRQTILFAGKTMNPVTK